MIKRPPNAIDGDMPAFGHGARIDEAGSPYPSSPRVRVLPEAK